MDVEAAGQGDLGSVLVGLGQDRRVAAPPQEVEHVVTVGHEHAAYLLLREFGRGTDFDRLGGTPDCESGYDQRLASRLTR